MTSALREFAELGDTKSEHLLTVLDSSRKNGPKTVPFRKLISFFRLRFDNFFSKITTNIVNY